MDYFFAWRYGKDSTIQGERPLCSRINLTDMDFNNWFNNLIADEIWYQPASMHHKPETFRSVANKVYMQELAKGFKPVGESRSHVYNILLKTPHDNKKVDWTARELKKLEKSKGDWVPVSPEKRAEYLNQLQAIIKGSTMMSSVPRISHKEEVENSDWLPKKPAPYPQTTKEEAYVRQRHLEYIKRNYEPRTGQKLPDWIPEDEFNLKYDNDML